jgi:hypothetical protein
MLILSFQDMMTSPHYSKINNTDKIQINLTEGVGVGLLYPKTNATLF